MDREHHAEVRAHIRELSDQLYIQRTMPETVCKLDHGG